jgi:hypothetical protein
VKVELDDLVVQLAEFSAAALLLHAFGEEQKLPELQHEGFGGTRAVGICEMRFEISQCFRHDARARRHGALV